MSALPKNQNVTSFSTKKISIYNMIHDFLDRLAVDSESTRTEYKRDIEKFFKFMTNKEISQLEVNDLDIKRSDVSKYQTFLKRHGNGGKGYKGSSINRMLASVASLFKLFQDDSVRYTAEDGEVRYITAGAFSVDKMKTTDSESYGMITHEEMSQMIELAKTLPNGNKKSLLLELASITSFRLDAINKLKWTDFRKEGNTWVIKTIDKSKVHEKSIPTDLYNRLVATQDSDRVFKMSSRTVERVIETLVEKMQLTDRNITFHSVKSYGIMEVWMATGGDVIKTAQQGNHSSFETTQKYYIKFENDYSIMPSLMVGKSLDLSPLEEMSKEQLLELIKSSDRSLQFALLNNLNK